MNPLFVSRAIYFFFYSAAAFTLPYISLYYLSEIHLSGSQIGVLMAISPLVATLASPTWGAFADVTRQHRRILLLAMAASTLLAVVWGFVTGFWGLALITAIFAFFNAPILPLVDNSVIEQLGPRRDEYGKQRVWGSVGWGIAGLASGWLLGRFGLQIIFFAYAILFSIGLLIARGFPVSPVSIGIRFSRDFKRLFSNKRWLLFLGVAWVTGAGIAMVSNYFMIYLKDLGATNFLLGVSLMVAIVSEIPVMYYSDRLLNRLGPGGMFVLGGCVFASRALVFSFAAAPWQAIVLQLLHGLTFAIIIVAGVEFASQIAPFGMGATAQGVFSGVFTGLGMATGGLLGGVLFGALGIRQTYQISAVMVGLAVLVFVLVSRRWQRQDSRL